MVRRPFVLKQDAIDGGYHGASQRCNVEAISGRDVRHNRITSEWRMSEI